MRIGRFIQNSSQNIENNLVDKTAKKCYNKKAAGSGGQVKREEREEAGLDLREKRDRRQRKEVPEKVFGRNFEKALDKRD